MLRSLEKKKMFSNVEHTEHYPNSCGEKETFHTNVHAILHACSDGDGGGNGRSRSFGAVIPKVRRWCGSESHFRATEGVPFTLELVKFGIFRG